MPINADAVRAPIESFARRDALMRAVAERLAAALTAGIAERGAACAALSGGTTPEPAYRLLGRCELDWRKITLALVDERFVPLTHEASNEAMLRRSLSLPLAQGAQLAPMYADTPTPQAAALRAEPQYRLLQFDIALMGMGSDGHTASWFPGAAGLAETLELANPRSVVALNAPQAAGAAARLTLTRSAMARARRILVLIQGEEKRARFEAAMSETMASAPIAALFALPACRPEVLWAP